MQFPQAGLGYRRLLLPPRTWDSLIHTASSTVTLQLRRSVVEINKERASHLVT